MRNLQVKKKTYFIVNGRQGTETFFPKAFWTFAFGPFFMKFANNVKDRRHFSNYVNNWKNDKNGDTRFSSDSGDIKNDINNELIHNQQTVMIYIMDAQAGLWGLLYKCAPLQITDHMLNNVKANL